jgi:hypothetical protein
MRADHTENIVLLLLGACMLRALTCNGRCLQSRRLATGLYATIYITASISYDFTQSAMAMEKACRSSRNDVGIPERCMKGLQRRHTGQKEVSCHLSKGGCV